MRLSRLRRAFPSPGALPVVLGILLPALVSLWLWPLPGRAAWADEPEPDPEDILGELVVDAAKVGPGRLVLPVVAVESPLTETPLEARVREVVTRDLDLSGEAEVWPAAHAAVRPERSDVAVDVEPWRAAGVEIVVRVHAERAPLGQIALRAEIHLLNAGAVAPLTSELVAALSSERLASHRLADGVLGAITGYEGPFASRLAFVRTVGGERTVFVIDPDGHAASARSPREHLATAPAFDAKGTLHWAASVDRGRYQVYRERQSEPIPLRPDGSVYGLAFDAAGERAAVSIATSTGIQLFLGDAGLRDLRPHTELSLALHPALSSRGRVAYAGTAKTRQRVYIEERPVSPRGLTASAPVFCRHPDGERLVYVVGVRSRSDLLVTDARGRDPVRITKGQGRNSHPACSPDGRLVAFFSTRRTGEGPGLYVMRIDGRRSRKISNVLGDSLQWSGRLAPEASKRPVPSASRGTSQQTSRGADRDGESTP